MWWVSSSTIAAADLWLFVATPAASDNPAELVAPAAGAIPGALGQIVHVDVAGASGWINLDSKSTVINTA